MSKKSVVKVRNAIAGRTNHGFFKRPVKAIPERFRTAYVRPRKNNDSETPSSIYA